MPATVARPFDIATHNGCITITSIATGKHRTVRINTGRNKTRWVSLLVGPDNKRDYKSFGKIEASDSETWIAVHRSVSGSLSGQGGRSFFLKLAKILMRPEDFLDRCKFDFEGHCIRCNVKLTHPISIICGMGPKCRKITGMIVPESVASGIGRKCAGK